jgi:hypothetical protein
MSVRSIGSGGQNEKIIQNAEPKKLSDDDLYQAAVVILGD